MRFLLLGIVAITLLVPHLAMASKKPLPAGLTAEERAYIQQNFDKYLKAKLAPLKGGKIPQGILTAPAEFDRADGVCFAWSGYSYLLTKLIKEVALDAKVWVMVDSDYEEDRVRTTLTNAGVIMENVSFNRIRTNSVWIRDYGQWWFHTEDGDREIVDLVYNRPRRYDDKQPSTFAEQVEIPAHKPSLILPGGNLIIDGSGVAIMTKMVFDSSEGCDPNLSVAKLEKYMKDYFGCTKVILLEQMKRDGTGHVDMFCKLLNERTFIVGEYATPGDGAAGNYKILNDNAAKLAAETNGKGEPYIVHRIPMPKYTGTSYTYTNSLIVNNKVLVPVYGHDSQEQALNIYRTLLPGYKVVGFDCNGIINANGAIHCISKLVMSDPLDIAHKAPEAVTAAQGISLKASITHNAAIKGMEVFWRTDKGDFKRLKMKATSEVDGDYETSLPGVEAGSKVQYYLRVEDVRGMYETSPEDASDTVVHTITVN